MIAGTTTRLQAALLGCGLAITNCLITSVSHTAAPQPTGFELPEILGSWKLREQAALQPSELSILQATDHWRRIYQCRKNGQIVIVTLLAGAGGPLASHHSETCHARNEFCSHGDTLLWSVPERPDQFRFQTLEPRQVERPALTVAYGWHDGDRWSAPRIPRLQLAGHAALHRLQITLRHPNGMSREARAAMQQFIQLTVEAMDARPLPSAHSHQTFSFKTRGRQQVGSG